MARSNSAVKYTDEFINYIRKNIKVTKRGNLKSKIYCTTKISINYKDFNIIIPKSHLVWLLTRNRWPREGFHIDHINDNSLDDSPFNLQELTPIANHIKRNTRVKKRKEANLKKAA